MSIEALFLGVACVGGPLLVAGLYLLFRILRPLLMGSGGVSPGVRRCPACAAELPADAPLGLCPRCLLLRGLADESSRPTSAPLVQSEPQGSAPATAAYRGPSGVPTPAELSAHFPQLEILDLLGQGGMGAVYKARQPKLDRFVALKILPPEAGRDPHFAERFSREARALARLDHPHIVGVYDFGEASGLHYLLMEFVDGVNLRQALRGGHLTPSQALPIVAQLCEALQFAHEEGVVHRDIKPENILLDRKGRVHIADFGLAKLLGHTAADFALTATHQVMGTLHYMAPEQMEKPLEVDHRADIYSLGVVFYEMLTGQLPLGRFAPPSQKMHIDVRLDEVVLRALEREPERRYQSISAVKTAVDSITSEPPVPTDRVPSVRSGGTDTAPMPSTPPAAAGTPGDTADLKAVQRQLEWPAFGLLFASALAVLSSAVNGFHLVMHWGRNQSDGPFGRLTEGVISIGCVSGLVIVPVMVFAALKLRRLQAYRLALSAGVLALLPCAWSFPISLFIGIWVLMVLTRPEVKAAFRGGKEDVPVEQQRRTSRRARGITLLLLAVAGIAVWQVGSLLLAEKVGAILQYEIVPDPNQASFQVDGYAKEMVRAIEQRLNRGGTRQAQVEAPANGRIEVRVFGRDVQRVNRIEKRLRAPGVLEFRIAADPVLDKEVVSQALAAQAPKLPADQPSKAKWVVADDRAAGGISGLATRKTHDGRLEVLVLLDRYDVGARHVARVRAAAAETGQAELRPVVGIDFTAQGATLMGRLVNVHVPIVDTDQRRQLAIILDGTLYVAPTIMAAVAESILISGNFTTDEVEDLAAVISAGPLPAALRLVSRRDID